MMTAESNEKIDEWTSVLKKITDDLTAYYPKAVVLFGSTARYLSGDTDDGFPKDIDLIVVGNNVPFAVTSKDYGVPFELHLLRINQIIDIAKTVRYDSTPVALSKLYGKALAKQHALTVIVASLLLGPTYNEFGIEQILIEALPDKRDYSMHKVLYGRSWWDRLVHYARERRGFLKRYSDKIVGQYEFDPDGQTIQYHGK